MNLRKVIFSILAILVIPGGSFRVPAAPTPVLAAPVFTAPLVTAPLLTAPVLKWTNKGCFNWGCETGWYSSPAVADLDGDGAPEIIAAAYAIVILDGATGSLEHRITPNNGRQWPSLVVADLEGDGDLEIVTAHGDGSLNVYNHAGDLDWSRRPSPGHELRSLAAYDLDADGSLEIIIASTQKEDQWMVYEHDGQERSGSWPQHSSDSDTNGYTAGCYNENIAAGDLDGDGRAEIIGPNDTHYLAAFNDDGTQILANPLYGASKFWSRVGVHVDHAVDLVGYADCGSEHRPNFASSAPIIVDVNSDGVLEAVVVGNVYNCTSPYSSLYEMPYLLKGDRTRWQADGFNWLQLPVPDGRAGPLTEDYDIIENNQPNPAAADLDGDGYLEILYPSYDGRMHVYWLDKKEHGDWPYSVYNPAEGLYRFATEPVVADLDGNGKAEVIFASWAQKGSGKTGKLHILDYLGKPLFEVALPAARPGFWNGVLAAPTLANIDGDPDLEVVVNTADTGMAAYDLPGSANAYILWGTGRGSTLRSGSLAKGLLQGSQLHASRTSAMPGENITFVITLNNPGPDLTNVTITDTLPGGLSFAGGLWASAGANLPSFTNGSVHWQGDVAHGAHISLQFQTTILPTDEPRTITNVAIMNDGQSASLTRQAVVIVHATRLHLPAIHL